MTAGCSLSCPSFVFIAYWLKMTWSKTDQPIIIKSFKKYGISKKMDGIKDNILWKDDATNEEEEEDHEEDNCKTGSFPV